MPISLAIWGRGGGGGGGGGGAHITGVSISLLHRCHRIRAPGKISSPGGSGLRILPPPPPPPPPEFLSVYEAREKAPPLGNFLRGANVRLRSLLLHLIYDTLHWKARQEPKAADLQDRLYTNILYQIAIQLGGADRTGTVCGTRLTENNLITKYAAVVLIV